MPVRKQFIARIFASDGTTFRKSYTTDEPSESSLPHLKNVPQFTSRINGGFGECVLDLSYPFDDFSEGTVIDFMNVVTITAVVTDTDLKTQNSHLIYTGFISRYEPYVNARDQGVSVTCLGLVSLLSLAYYMSGSSFTVTHSSDDPETIGRAIIDHYNGVYSAFSQLSYSGDTTDPVGTAVSVSFEDQKWSDALKKTGELSPGWWWKIDESGQYWLKPKPTVSTHTFTIGRDIVSLTAPKSSEKVVNDAVVRWSSGTATDSDAASITAFGKRTKIVSDSGLTDANAGSQRAAKEVDEGEEETTGSTLVIGAPYDIESIKVGEACVIRNFKKSSTFFGSAPLQIASVQYLGDTVRIELEKENADFGQELASFVQSA